MNNPHIYEVEEGRHSTYSSSTGERVLFTENEMEEAVHEYVNDTGYEIITPEDFDEWSGEKEGRTPSSNNLSDGFGSFGSAMSYIGYTYMRKTEETDVTKNIVRDLERLFDYEVWHGEIQLRYRELGGDRRYPAGTADVVVDELNLAIECKEGSSTSLKKAIGQCLCYRLSGYKSVVCTTDRMMDKMRRLFYENDVPVIVYDSIPGGEITSSGFVYDGIEIFGDRWDIYRRKDIDDFLIQLDIETE